MGSSSMIEIGGGPGLLLRLIGTNFWEVSTSTEMMMMMMMVMVSTSNLKLLKTNTEKILPKNPWFQCSFLQVKLGPKLRVFGTCKDKIPPKRLLLETPVFHPPIFSGPMCTWGSIIGSLYVWNHFETFWRLSWRRPNEDQVKTANVVNVVTSLANEDLMKTWLMKWRSHEVKTWIISDKISIKYLI